MNIFHSIKHRFSDLGRVFRNECRLISKDGGVLIFFFLLTFAYPIVYTLIYNPEVVEDIPVAVVDDSRSMESRTLVRKASATPAIRIFDYCANMADAKRLMAENEVFGILHIPSDYADKLATGEQAHVQFYSDMSLLIRYRSFLTALTDLQLEVAQETTIERVNVSGLASLVGSGASLPIKSNSNFLGDDEQGFASFVIPGIIILILQQSMILGITLIGATSRERRRRNNGADSQSIEDVPSFVTIWGKSLAYVVAYIPITIYVLHFIPEIFRLPHYGSATDYLLFVLPMLLATSFLGQAIVYFTKERESGFIVIVFTSVLFLFLSGLTWPRYAMSEIWQWVGNLIPAVWGVEGFVRINSNAATLGEVAPSFLALWILVAVYMSVAWGVTAYLRAKRT